MVPFILAEHYVDLDYDDLDAVQLLMLYGMLTRASGLCKTNHVAFTPTYRWTYLGDDIDREAHLIYRTLMNKLRPVTDMLYYVYSVDGAMSTHDDGIEDPY